MKTITLALIGLLFCVSAQASQRVVVLDFELRDITSLPNTPQEIIRTASFAPLLAEAIKNTGDYDIIPIKPAEQAAANPSAGYLFDYSDEAAKLGKRHDADWIIVTRHSKPSFLFSYLMAHLVNIKTHQQVGSYAIEMKGTHQKVTQHSINALAKKIQQRLGADAPSTQP
ncbi:MAG: DUF2380 domain-containing protein [Methylovulum sp.]|nr:DUF2380 domain-containing protein [Methylovulum sp.]